MSEFMNATPFIGIAIVYRVAHKTHRIVFVNSWAGSVAVKFTGEHERVIYPPPLLTTVFKGRDKVHLFLKDESRHLFNAS